MILPWCQSWASTSARPRSVLVASDSVLRCWREPCGSAKQHGGMHGPATRAKDPVLFARLLGCWSDVLLQCSHMPRKKVFFIAVTFFHVFLCVPPDLKLCRRRPAMCMYLRNTNIFHMLQLRFVMFFATSTVVYVCLRRHESILMCMYISSFLLMVRRFLCRFSIPSNNTC